MKLASRLFLACALGALAVAAQAPPFGARSARLAALGKLWAAAKYFHPFLAYRDIDWDGALVSALPKAAAANSASEYAAAVESMLGYLGDPATGVVRTPSVPKRRPSGAPLAHRTEDGILVITLNPETAAPQRQDSLRGLRQAASEITSARGVVFDLRFQEHWTAQDSSTVGLLFIAGALNGRLAFGPLQAPGQRSRMHSGLASPFNGGSVYFHSAFNVRDGALIAPAPGIAEKPVVFLIDSSSSLPPIAPALQFAGKAKIVAQGGASDLSLVDTQQVELPGGVKVRLRIAELVYADGTTGLSPDLAVPAAEPAGGEDMALQAALGQARNPGRTVLARPKLPAYGVPHREESYAGEEFPAWEHRVMAGFRIWAAFQYFFAYRDLMGEDWDRVLEESLPKLEQAADARQYALAVAEMVARVHDSHAASIDSRALLEFFGAAPPPIRTRIIGGLPVVTALLDEESARKAGIAVGDVVLKVDGEDAAARMTRLSAYLAASTPQSLENLVMQRWLNGPFMSTVKLTIRGRDDRIREVRLQRNGDARRRWRTCEVIQTLPGNIGYVDLDRLPPERVDEMFEKLKSAKAIIFDMRGYPQGTAWLIAPRLTERKSVVAARFRRPLALFPEGRSGDVTTLGAGWDFVQYFPDSDKWKYRGPTVMLIDERAMSQAEHAGLFFEAANGTKFIGSRTAGANGDVARFPVPGGITISFSGHDIRHADGRQLQRVGLIPDLEVKPTIAGIRAGRDEVLERALEYLGVNGARLSRVGEAP